MAEGNGSSPEVKVPKIPPVYGVELIGDLKPDHPSNRKRNQIVKNRVESKIISFPSPKEK